MKEMMRQTSAVTITGDRDLLLRALAAFPRTISAYDVELSTSESVIEKLRKPTLTAYLVYEARGANAHDISRHRDGIQRALGVSIRVDSIGRVPA
jgi:hypothetical protein